MGTSTDVGDVGDGPAGMAAAALVASARVSAERTGWLRQRRASGKVGS